MAIKYIDRRSIRSLRARVACAASRVRVLGADLVRTTLTLALSQWERGPCVAA